MKSPTSPNLFQRANDSNKLVARSNASSIYKDGRQRNDSCPSPLDEDETVIVLGSGEKIRVKEVSSAKMNQYANMFRDQKNKFSSSTINQQPRGTAQPLGQNCEPKFGFRTRTNSLVNSVCSEISFRMKFMKDM